MRRTRRGRFAAAVVAVVAAATVTATRGGMPSAGAAPADRPAATGEAASPNVPAVAPTQDDVAALSGEGFLGRFGCYACIGSALASTSYATAISNLFLSACLDICKIVM